MEEVDLGQKFNLLLEKEVNRLERVIARQQSEGLSHQK